ncbi:flagellar biosynthesis anti-sigma factor FlgM [Clostridium sp. DL1XJH146]
MKIYNNNYYDKNLYTNNSTSKDSKVSEKEKKAVKTSSGDRIELSSTGIKLKSYIDKIEEIDKARMSKIDDIKSKIKEGKYKVSSEELGEKILEKLSSDDTIKGE